MSSLTFLGDIWLPRPFRVTIPFDGEFVFNLEFPITKCPTPAHRKISLCAEENYIEATFGKKPLAVCLANNHIMDYGAEGYADTLVALKSSGIRYFGAGTLAENCNNPLVVSVDRQLVGLLGYVCPTTHPVFAEGESPGVRPIDLDRIRLDIAVARGQGAHRVIVNLHWGEEGVGVPTPQAVDLAAKILETGADLIVGHHSHCIQSCSACGSKSVFYGLGNCIFPNAHALSHTGSGFRQYQVRFPARNGISLMVRYDLDTSRAASSMLRFDGSELTVHKTKGFDFSLPQLDDGQYAAYFRRRSNFDALKFSVGRYLLQPSLPNPQLFSYALRFLARSAGFGARSGGPWTADGR